MLDGKMSSPISSLLKAQTLDRYVTSRRRTPQRERRDFIHKRDLDKYQAN
jgi:hypothetical protein